MIQISNVYKRSKHSEAEQREDEWTDEVPSSLIIEGISISSPLGAD